MARAILPPSLPPPPRKSEREENFVRDCENNSGRKRIGEKEKKGEERRGEEERHTQWRLGRDIALCFLSGQMIYRVSPYIAASYYNPAKTRKGLCESHRESATEGEGGDGVEKERGWSGKYERAKYDMGGITYLWASGTGTEANFRQILVGNNVRAIGT